MRGVASRRARVATVKSSVVSLAWAHQGDPGDPGGEGEGERWPRNRTRVATVESSKVSLAWAHQEDPGGEGAVGMGIDDNYRGGDDNYPRLVMKMGAVRREEGRGRNRQK